MRLIDLDALGIGKCNPDVFDDKGYAKGWNSAIEILQNANTVDAVPVRRCKDCKYYDPLDDNRPFSCPLMGEVMKDDFCSKGERKGGADDAAD